ncbi:unnamed protein product [Dovyalis caffra]|uniref:RING-type E3 ubiquitin transferase n=1 Tax=Dovyalis caffra TaxID=77055 RepID=A0AAV1RCM7_9ROSI|nr:unnamed protein product [Dovyalis caffra]
MILKTKRKCQDVLVLLADLVMDSRTTTTASYWCYRCTRFVNVSPHNDDEEHNHTSNITCPHCDGGFVEEIRSNSDSDNRQNRSRVSNLIRNRNRHNSRNAGDRSPFNPVIVLRGTTPAAAAEDSEEGSAYEFYYDDGTGSGLRPVPETMSQFLMGSGFDRLLDQLSQIEINSLGRSVPNPPASKAVVESMPRVEINQTHVVSDTYCAVCKEAFEIGNEAREMPCKHIYHSDCILPWLAMRNSCPVCRHELPVENSEEEEVEGDLVGLTIWRLPGGGFAVGRFNGGRRGGEREFPGVFTEMDGGGNGGYSGNSRPRDWDSWVTRSRRRESISGNGGFRRVFRGLASFLRRIRPNSSSRMRVHGSESESIERSYSSRVTRRRRGLDLEVEEGADRW